MYVLMDLIIKLSMCLIYLKLPDFCLPTFERSEKLSVSLLYNVMFAIGTIFFKLLLLARLNFVISKFDDQRCANNKPARARIAIAFYGLSRSLKSTLPTIQRHVFDVMDRENITFDVFWSSLAVGKVDNPRSGERGVPIDQTDFNLMHPCVYTIISQSVVVPMEFNQFLKARKELNIEDHDPFQDNFISIRNLLGAFHTMRNVDSMISLYSNDNNITYDAILVMRPDTAVVTDIDIQDHIDEIKHNNTRVSKPENDGGIGTIWVPDFSHSSGLNDRAAYGSPHVMSLYLQRGTAFRDEPVARDKRPNGEIFLKDYLTSNRIAVEYSNLRLLRIRADRSVAGNDLDPMSLNLYKQSLNKVYERCIIKVKSKSFLNAAKC